ncbi:MarR family transcriptional regulator, partial [Enterococcus faecalis]|uniref:MarR family transcriptional regulator n=1 Tax=Enterococcus faecalis TaxID=1351 RepID=UPI003CC6DADA
LKVLDQKITKVFEEQVVLSLTRYELLMILKERQKCLQTEIQEHLKIDSGAVTRLLIILEEKQYVTRLRNPENNREVLVHLTEKAQQELQLCTAKQQTVTEIIPSTFTKDD